MKKKSIIYVNRKGELICVELGVPNCRFKGCVTAIKEMNDELYFVALIKRFLFRPSKISNLEKNKL